MCFYGYKMYLVNKIKVYFTLLLTSERGIFSILFSDNFKQI